MNDNIVKNKGDSFNKKSSNKQKQLKQILTHKHNSTYQNQKYQYIANYKGRFVLFITIISLPSF